VCTSGRSIRFEGNRIKLTKKDSGEGAHKGHHHFIKKGLVAEVEGNEVRLSANAAVAVTMEQEETAKPIWLELYPLKRVLPHTQENTMDKDRIEGAAEQAKGKVKEVAGKITGDSKLEGEGKADQVAGKIQNTIGGIKDTLRGK
jgi:uncharacterized protein YjbJ (UPF0337 family)